MYVHEMVDCGPEESLLNFKSALEHILDILSYLYLVQYVIFWRTFAVSECFSVVKMALNYLD